MKKYEYKEVYLEESKFEEQLNEFADQGWEFVTIIAAIYRAYDVLLRRPKD